MMPDGFDQELSSSTFIGSTFPFVGPEDSSGAMAGPSSTVLQVQTRAQAQQAAAQAQARDQAHQLQAQARNPQMQASQHQPAYPTRFQVMQAAASGSHVHGRGSSGDGDDGGQQHHQHQHQQPQQHRPGQYRSPQSAQPRQLTTQRSFPGPLAAPANVAAARSPASFESHTSPARQRRTTISTRSGLGISASASQLDTDPSIGSPFQSQGPGTPMSMSPYSGETAHLFAGMGLSTPSNPLASQNHPPPSQGSSSAASSTPWHDGSPDFSIGSSQTSFVLTEPGTANPSPSHGPTSSARGHVPLRMLESHADESALTESHLASLGSQNQAFLNQSPSFQFLSGSNEANRLVIRPHRPTHVPQPSTSSLASTASSTPYHPGIPFIPTTRNLPARPVKNEQGLDTAYLQFCLYCNPQVNLQPPPIGLDELQRLFGSVPKSGDKRFTPWQVFQAMQKLGPKGNKTWVKLAQDLGVEATDSPQRFNQYGVRLKKWLMSLHIDAFFDYLMFKRNPYFENPQGRGNSAAEGEEEDLVIKTLLEGAPKRGRKRGSDQGRTTRADSIASLVPAKRGRFPPTSDIQSGEVESGDEEWAADPDETPDSASISTGAWFEGTNRFGMSPPNSAASAVSGATSEFATAFGGLSTINPHPHSRPQTASGLSAGDKMDADVQMGSSINSSFYGLLPSAQLVPHDRFAGPPNKRPRLRNEDDLQQLASEDDILRQELANAGLSDADIVRCLGLIAARNLLPSTFGAVTGSRYHVAASCKVTDVRVRRNGIGDVDGGLARRMSTRSARTSGSAAPSASASRKGSGEGLNAAAVAEGRRVGTAYVISWSIQRGAMKATLEVELGDGETPLGEGAREEDEARMVQLQAVVSGVRGILAQHGCL